MMARKIDTMPPRTGGKPIYPWNEWLDGSVWELTSGEDFTVGMSSLVAIARQAAARRGITVTTRWRGSAVYIQAHLNGGAS